MTPLPFVAIIILTLGFEALLFGDELVTRAFYDEPFNVAFSECSFQPGKIPILSDVGAGVGYIGCILANFFRLIGNVVVFILGFFRFLYYLVTFNIPGAPVIVRIIFGTLIGFPIVVFIATYLRGVKA